jgi:hypothetical protein
MFGGFGRTISTAEYPTLFADAYDNLWCEALYRGSGAPGVLPGSISSAELNGEVGRLNRS